MRSVSTMHGNVFQWVEDCLARNLDGAPADGTVWKEACKDETSLRVVRGGSWLLDRLLLRSALRDGESPDYRFIFLGFRVGRTLLPP
jgi:formylglycine-generating enzyme required for sulfatase activity